jgi:hypothetical protein
MLYWVSFAGEGPGDFRGVVIVEACTFEGAVNEATRRGLNPGGEAAIFEVPTAAHRHQAWPYRNRLLQKPEIEQIFGLAAADVNDVLKAAGDRGALLCTKCNQPGDHHH